MPISPPGLAHHENRRHPSVLEAILHMAAALLRAAARR